MKFCLLCKRYYTNKDLITDRFGRLYHLPAQLSKLGHSGFVAAADYRNSTVKKLQIPGVVFYSLPFSTLNCFTFFSKTYRRLQRFNPDILIASGDSYIGAVGFLYARFLGIPFIFDVYDDYTAFESNKIPGMKTLFYYSIRKADLITTASAPLQRLISQFNKSVVTIENGTDLSIFKPIPWDYARSILSIKKDKKVIGFFGSIEKKRGVETLMEAISLLKASYSNLVLLMAGKNNLQLKLNNPYIDYRGMVAQEKIPLFINACDVVVIPYLSNKLEEMTNACKIAEYLACSVPVVATRVSNHAEIFSDALQGICKPGDAQDMARAIRFQLETPQLVNFSKNLTWEHLGEKLSDALEKLIKNPLLPATF
jgi:glycosyltransferase involved in cell wall biosynthesis